MKTIQELYNEVMNSQELKAKLIEASKAGKQEEFLKAHGCEATLEEVKAFLEAKAQDDAPLSLNEMENAAGGVCNDKSAEDVCLSVFSAGFGCVIKVALTSATHGHVGRRNDSESRLCTED